MNRKEGNTDFSSKSDGKSNTAYPLLTVNSLIGNITYAPRMFLRKLWLSTLQLSKQYCISL